MRKSFFTIIALIGMFFPLRTQASIVINEIMYDTPAADDGREWIEILNTGTEVVDMTDWKLFEANVNHGFVVSQGGMEIVPGGFAVVADNPQKFLLDWPEFSGTLIDSAFSLSNTGEPLAIKDAQGNSINTFTYASSLGAAGDGMTLQRIGPDWLAAVPTPGVSNEPDAPSEELLPIDELENPVEPAPEESLPGGSLSQDEPIDPPSDMPDDPELLLDLPPNDPGLLDDEEIQTPPEPSGHTMIIINEIMYDELGSDDNHEWIELLNLGPASTDIADWKLIESDVDHGLTLIQGSSVLGVADFLIIAEDSDTFLVEHPDFTGTIFDSSFSLSNSSETIALKDVAHTIHSQSTYISTSGAAGDGRSLQHFDAGFIAALPTPGAVNVFDPENLIEQAESGSFGGGEVFDNDTAPLITEKLSSINVSQIDAPVQTETVPTDDSLHSSLLYSIVMRDTYGFVQIENPTDAVVDISGLKLSFEEKVFVVPLHTIVASKSIVVIANTKARFVGANRAVLSDGVLVIE